MGTKESIDSALSRLSYRVNSKKMIMELSFNKEPIFVLHLQGIRSLVSSFFNESQGQPKLQQVANVFIELYKKRYPTVKRSLKDFPDKDQKCFQQLVDIVDDFNNKYPEAKLTYKRYIQAHFHFYCNSFNTAPKPSFFVTDNAVRRIDTVIQDFDEKWPTDEKLEQYFKNNKSKASPDEKKEQKVDIRLAGNKMWTTTADTQTPLKDNNRFVSLKKKVLEEKANIYEARYVRDCYLVRGQKDLMQPEIEQYIEELEALAVKLNVKLG